MPSRACAAIFGLPTLVEAASEIAEEYRPGNPRRLTDGQVKEKLESLSQLYNRVSEGIRRYGEEG